MKLDEKIDILLYENFNLKEGEPLPWQVLAAAFVASETANFVMDRCAKLVSIIIGKTVSKEGIEKWVDMDDDSFLRNSAD